MAEEDRLQSSVAHYSWRGRNSSATREKDRAVSEFLMVSACVANVSIKREVENSILGCIC